MPKCKVNPKWLDGCDGTGRNISEWCKIKNESDVICTICNCILVCTQKGKQAILQHCETKKHKDSVKIKFDPLQLHLSGQSNVGASTAKTLQITDFLVQDASIKAELVWAMKMIHCNLSATACENIGNEFKCMFPGEISKNFSMGRTKFAYYVSEALGPYFREEMIRDVEKEYFSICYDETTNNESQKELQIKIRYFSET